MHQGEGCDLLADIPEGAAGEVKLNVGVGADAREITVPAISPYAAVKASDFVSVTWNTFSQHWDIGSFHGGADVEPGGGLEQVDDANAPDDGKLRVKVADIDLRFIEVCEPGSIDVISVTSPFPSLVGAAVEGSEIVSHVAGELPPYVVGTLSGSRR